MKVLLFLSALIALVSAQCSSNGVLVGASCACYSGFTGAICDTDSTAGCQFPTVAPLITSTVAELNTTVSRITGNNFIFTVQSPASFQRRFTEISLAGNSSCSYPTSTVAKTFVGCTDVYTGTFSIPAVKACGFTQSESATHTILSGAIAVTAVDPVATFRGTPISRVTSSSLRVALSLPKTYTLTTANLTVISPIDILRAVTRQEYDPESDSATIEITTSVQWPYILVFNQTLQLPNVAFTASTPVASGVGADCLADSGACLQKTTITINSITGSSICNFNGVLQLQWTSACRTIPTGCPISGNDLHSISATLVSGDLCPTFEVVSSLTGDLFAYPSDAFTTQSISFVANLPVFLKIALTASVEIQAIEISRVTVFVNGVPNVILASRNPQSGFGAINFQPNVGSLASTDPSTLGFSFVATYGESDAIFLSSGPSVQLFTVQAELQVTYVTSFKREVLVEQITVSKDMVLDATRA